jgi:hypothetical protein
MPIPAIAVPIVKTLVAGKVKNALSPKDAQDTRENRNMNKTVDQATSLGVDLFNRM